MASTLTVSSAGKDRQVCQSAVNNYMRNNYKTLQDTQLVQLIVHWVIMSNVMGSNPARSDLFLHPPTMISNGRVHL